MPKIIENLRDDILSESLKIIRDEGVDRLSIRYLSSRLAIAPSTIYNYFDSKEQIVRVLIKAHWEKALDDIDNMCRKKINIRTALPEIVENLRSCVKPLLQFHIKAAIGKNKSSEFDFGNIIIDPLSRRMKLLITGSGIPETDAEEMAPVLSKLAIACMCDPGLDIEEIIRTTSKMQTEERQNA